MNNNDYDLNDTMNDTTTDSISIDLSNTNQHFSYGTAATQMLTGAVSPTNISFGVGINSAWPNTSLTPSWGIYSAPTTTIDFNTVHAKGTIKAEEIEIGGISLTEILEKIEERLAILRPNKSLEGRWEQLKALGEEYRKLEKELQEMEVVWNILEK